MARRIKVVYESGVLRPLEPLPFAEHHYIVACLQPLKNRLFPVVFFLPAHHEANLLFFVFASLLRLHFAVNRLYAAVFFD